MELNHDEIRRYSRHLILPEVGLAGQKKLRSTSVLCIGAGGLGSPIAIYLAAAGIGKLGIVDFDNVDYSNLQRQILHTSKDLGRNKVDSARTRLNDLNAEVTVETHAARVTEDNAIDLMQGYDFIIDGSDNFETKFLVNDAAVALRKPFSHAGIIRFQGQTMTVIPRISACYRCVFQEPPPPGEIPGALS